MHRYLTLALFVALVLGGGTLIGLMTLPGEWYAGLAKPSFNPPNWIFAPVWTLLYIMVAVAGWRTWQHSPRSAAMAVWFIQLALNFVWSLAFFGAHRIGAAQVLALDFSPKMLELARLKALPARFLQADLLGEWPAELESALFDRIVSTWPRWIRSCPAYIATSFAIEPSNTPITREAMNAVTRLIASHAQRFWNDFQTEAKTSSSSFRPACASTGRPRSAKAPNATAAAARRERERGAVHRYGRP